MSDLHLEFGPLVEKLEGEVLVIAGDVTVKNKVQWINDVSERFVHVVYVLGNHEYWRQNLDNTERKTREQLASNVYLLQNESVTLEGVTFHGGTLWTDFERGSPLSYMYCADVNVGVKDYKRIRADGGTSRFSPQRAHTEHNVTKLYLRDNVKTGDVVVTHHAPCRLSLGEHYKQSTINGAYASDLTEVMFETEPVLWFHGHVHNNSDYMIGETRVLCNPRGYAGYDLNEDFDLNAFVEI